MLSPTFIWMIIACFLLVAEMLTGGFALMAFGIGAMAAAIPAALTLSLTWQLVTFTVVSLLFFFFIRPLMLRWWKEHERQVPQTNALGLIGKTGKVVERIDHEARTGRVVIDGDNFMARSEDESIIEEGVKVEIMALDSTILIVRSQV